MLMAKRLLVLGTAITTFSLPGIVEAQETADPPPQTSSGASIQEIIVTATRRDTNLQTTPIAVSAVDRTIIDRAAPHDLGDLAAFVPNFSGAKVTGFNSASFSMRGVGANSSIVYFEAPVTVLVDDFVFSSIQTQLLDPFDIEQLEVLRGPQGTLFGKNTTGGAVVVRTRKPNLNAFGLEAVGEVGDFGTRKAKASVNVPIADTLAVRLVGGYNYSKGFMRNGACFGPLVTADPNYSGLTGCGNAKRRNGDDAFNGRVKVLWEPSSRFSALFQYEILRDYTEPPAAVNETPLNDPSWAWNLLGLPAQTGDPLKMGALGERKSPFIDNLNNSVKADGFYLTLNWDTDVGTLTAVNGYRNQRTRVSLTPSSTPDIVGRDGTIMTIYDSGRNDNRKTFQHELRFASDFGGAFDFVAGAFYQHEKIDFSDPQTAGFQDLLGATTPYGPYNENTFAIANLQRSWSRALYIEGTYKFTPELSLTGGFRYTWDKKRWAGRQQAFLQDIVGDPLATPDQYDVMDLVDFDRFPVGVVQSRKSWSDPSYRVILSYQATPDIFTYASYSRGFKSGGYNDQSGSFAAYGNDLAAFQASAAPTDPETADSFEAGVKSSFLDRRVQLNVTGFHVTYKDLQKQINVPIVVNGQPFQEVRFFNAAKAVVKGVEVELTTIPVEGLTLRGNLGYQDGKYKEYITLLPAGYDLATSPLDRTPKWQWTVDGTYQFDLGNIGQVTLNGNVGYTGRNLYTQSLASPAANSYLNARTLVNASIALTPADSGVTIRLIGRNLTDKRYRVASQSIGGLWIWSVYGAPRYFGGEISFRM